MWNLVLKETDSYSVSGFEITEKERNDTFQNFVIKYKLQMMTKLNRQKK